jgi:hypothetical protein
VQAEELVVEIFARSPGAHDVIDVSALASQGWALEQDMFVRFFCPGGTASARERGNR